MFTIKSEEELNLHIELIDRILLVVFDYPYFDDHNFEEARVRAFEIWPKYSPNFVTLLTEYYQDIFLKHIEKTPNKTPAPKNFFPDSFQFFMCEPRKIFECGIVDFNKNPKLNISRFIEPEKDRSNITPEPMPSNLLKVNERKILYEVVSEIPNEIDSELLGVLPLRGTSKAMPQSSRYQRR